MTVAPHGEADHLAAIRAAVTEDALFQRAVNDCIAAMMRHTIGLSLTDATNALDRLRAAFELERVRR